MRMRRLVVDVAMREVFTAYAAPILNAAPWGRDWQVVFSDAGDIERAPDADAIFIRSKTRVHAGNISPRLAFIGSAVSGEDHLDKAAIKNAGIHLATAGGCNAQAVAEFTLTILLHHHIRVRPMTTIGIVGYGHIGARLTRFLAALGFTVRVYDPWADVPTKHAASLDEVLAADAITLHAALNDRKPYPSRNLLTAQHLRALSSEQALINCARGELTELPEVAADIRATLYLDCWHDEPVINPALAARAALATPHIAGHSVEAKVRGLAMVMSAFCAWQEACEANSPSDAHHITDAPPNTHIAPANIPTLAPPLTINMADITEHTTAPNNDDAQEHARENTQYAPSTINQAALAALLYLLEANHSPWQDALAAPYTDFAERRANYPNRYELAARGITLHSTPEHLRTALATALHTLGVPTNIT